jgi:hypothetical protein
MIPGQDLESQTELKSTVGVLADLIGLAGLSPADQAIRYEQLHAGLAGLLDSTGNVAVTGSTGDVSRR